jgi:hypothetical protein
VTDTARHVNTPMTRLWEGCRFTLEPVTNTDFQLGREVLVEGIKGFVSTESIPDIVLLQAAQKIGRTSLLKLLARHGFTDFRGEDVRTILVDARMWSYERSRQDVARDLIDSLRRAAGAGEARLGFHDAVEELAARSTKLVLLVDRGEVLLDPGLLAVVDLVALLNEALPSLAVVLSFGPSDQTSLYQGLHHMGHVAQAVREVSPVWARTSRFQMFGLPRWATERFLRWAGGGLFKLNERELAWVMDLAGNHPLLLNRVGLTVCRHKLCSDGSELSGDDMTMIENELDKDLGPMVRAIVQRLMAAADGQEAVRAARDLAMCSDKRVVEHDSKESHLAAILAGEGLVDVEYADGASVTRPIEDLADGAPIFYSMRARLLRRILTNSEAGEHASSPTGHQPIRAARRQRAARGSSVTISHSQMPNMTVSLTDIEERLMRRFLESPGSTLSIEQLTDAVWGQLPGPEGDRWRGRLVQRMSLLRRKLAPHFATDPIINIYGQGYRLAVSDSVALSPSYSL